MNLVEVPSFEANSQFNQTWWTKPSSAKTGAQYELVDSGQPVARVEANDGALEYPELWGLARDDRYLEIKFIEVANNHLGLGHGRAILSLLSQRYPGRRLAAAASEGAEGFYGHLGWTRHEHVEEEFDDDGEPFGHYHPLYVAPLWW